MSPASPTRVVALSLLLGCVCGETAMPEPMADAIRDLGLDGCTPSDYVSIPELALDFSKAGGRDIPQSHSTELPILIAMGLQKGFGMNGIQADWTLAYVHKEVTAAKMKQLLISNQISVVAADYMKREKLPLGEYQKIRAAAQVSEEAALGGILNVVGSHVHYSHSGGAPATGDYAESQQVGTTVTAEQSLTNVMSTLPTQVTGPQLQQPIHAQSPTDVVGATPAAGLLHAQRALFHAQQYHMAKQQELTEVADWHAQEANKNAAEMTAPQSPNVQQQPTVGQQTPPVQALPPATPTGMLELASSFLELNTYEDMSDYSPHHPSRDWNVDDDFEPSHLSEEEQRFRLDELERIKREHAEDAAASFLQDPVEDDGFSSLIEQQVFTSAELASRAQRIGEFQAILPEYRRLAESYVEENPTQQVMFALTPRATAASSAMETPPGMESPKTRQDKNPPVSLEGANPHSRNQPAYEDEEMDEFGHVSSSSVMQVGDPVFATNDPPSAARRCPLLMVDAAAVAEGRVNNGFPSWNPQVVASPNPLRALQVALGLLYPNSNLADGAALVSVPPQKGYIDAEGNLNIDAGSESNKNYLTRLAEKQPFKIELLAGLDAEAAQRRTVTLQDGNPGASPVDDNRKVPWLFDFLPGAN